MIDFTITTTVRAPRETVFDVLTDHAAYAGITPLRSSSLERPGNADPNGVGAIRRLGLVGPPLREEITEFDRPSRFVYRLLSGLPVRDHVGSVELQADGATSTILSYRVTSKPRLPLPIGPVLRLGVKQLVNGVVKESERRAGKR